MPESTDDRAAWCRAPAVSEVLDAERRWLATCREPAGSGALVRLAPDAPSVVGGEGELVLSCRIDGVFEGSLSGRLDALPFVDGCVRRLVLQHVQELGATGVDAFGEWLRVLEPGGELVVIGFNPLSVWSGWFGLRGRGPRARMAGRVRGLCERHGLRHTETVWLGSRWPGAAAGSTPPTAGPFGFGRPVYALRLARGGSNVVPLRFAAPGRAERSAPGLVPTASTRSAVGAE